MVDIEARRERRRLYYRNNRHKWSRYYADNRETIRRKQEAHYHRNKASLAEQQKVYRAANKLKIREYLRKYAQRNAERLRRYRQEWRRSNVQHLRNEKRRYYEMNRETIIANVSLWQRRNRERVNEKNRKWIRQERMAAIRAFGGRCRKCGYREVLEILQFDHVIAVRDGRKCTFGHREAMRDRRRFQLLCPNCHAKKTVLETRKEVVTETALMARRVRTRALALYAACCAACSFDDPDCLQLDHKTRVHCGGARRRRLKTEQEALKNPGLFQCLCATCHAIKTLTEVSKDA